jgi:anaerobic dimethyl sulfoxide reductase subunit C (anchor subunit)
VHFYAQRKAGVEEADRLSDRALLVIGPVLILGMIASLFHLGDPLSAVRAVTNVGSSWLSREILFGVIFAALGAVFALMQWRKISTFAVRNVVALLAAVAGVALVYSMSNVYMLPTQPAWNTAVTPILFFAATLLLGLMAMGAAFVANHAYLKRRADAGMETQMELMCGSLRWISLASVVLVGVELVVMPLYVAQLSTGEAAALESARLMIQDFGVVFALRLILAFVGAGVFGLFLYRSASARDERRIATVVYAAFALVLVAEVLGRFLFYAVQSGISV